MPSVSQESVATQPDAESSVIAEPIAKSWSLLDDDVWIMMMASYWRITSAIDRAVEDATADLPDFLAADVARETRETAYAEERRIWSAGMDRLCELYGVSEGGLETAEPVQGALL